jgi:hypothetical protein
MKTNEVCWLMPGLLLTSCAPVAGRHALSERGADTVADLDGGLPSRS